MITFKTEKISQRVTKITAPSLELMYLVEGNDRAALLDTGSGIGHLSPIIKKLTDKPVIVLLTHGHVDHAMGAAEFDTVYMNHEDDYIYVQHAEDRFRREGLFLCTQKDQITEDEFIPALPLSAIRGMKEGDSFNLGEETIDIFACPGHTRGCLVMLMREERILLLGDACNYRTFMHEPSSTTITEYEESLKRLKPLIAGKYERILLSHGDGEADLRIIDGVIRVCEDIKAGNTDDIFFRFKDTQGYIAKAEIKETVRVDGGIGNIVYNKSRIR